MRWCLLHLKKICENQNLYSDPTVVHIDFECEVITAIIQVFGQYVYIQGCFTIWHNKPIGKYKS